MPDVRRLATVSGRVHGVFFRDATVEQARRLGLSGSVGNADDGTVRVDAQGDAEAVDSLVAWLHDGPPDASVSGVEVTDAEPTDVSGFSSA